VIHREKLFDVSQRRRMSKLAIYGGKPAVPAGAVKPWPLIEKTDEDMVLAALRSNHHFFGP